MPQKPKDQPDDHSSVPTKAQGNDISSDLAFRPNPLRRLGASLPWIYTLVGPGLGSGLVAYYLVIQGMPQHFLGQILGLLVVSIFLGLGLSHGTTLALILGYQLGMVGIVVWVPAFILANVVGLLGARWWLRAAGNIDTLMIKNPKAKDQIQRLDQRLASQGAWAIFWFRMSPVVPFALGTMVLARTKIKMRTIFIMGLLGAVPRTLVVMQLGTLAPDIRLLLEGKQQPTWSMVVGVLLLVISAVGLWVWGRTQLAQPDAQKTSIQDRSPQ